MISIIISSLLELLKLLNDAIHNTVKGKIHISKGWHTGLKPMSVDELEITISQL